MNKEEERRISRLIMEMQIRLRKEEEDQKKEDEIL